MFKKGQKGLIISISVLIVLFLSVVACSNGNGNGNNEEAATPETGQTDTGTGQQAPAETAGAEKTKFSYYVNEFTYGHLAYGINWPAIQEAANVEVELINAGDRGQYNQNLNLLMASGELPDTLWISMDFANQYGSEGALVDLRPLIEEHAPHIKAYLEANSIFELQSTAQDGGIYAMMWRYTTNPTWGWHYRQDWADQLGIAPPASLDEFTDMLRLVKQNNPSGQSNFYPLIFQNYGHLSTVSNMMFDYGYLDYGRDNIYDPNYKKYIEWLRLLNAEGLIDPESARGAMTEDLMLSKLLNGNSFIYYRAMANAEYLTINGREFDPEFTFAAIPSVTADYVTKPAYYPGFWSTGLQPGNAVAITKDAKDPVGIIKFFDFLFSEEGMTLKNWGIEGESYVVENGVKKFIIDSVDVYGSDPNSTEPHWRILIPGSFSLPGPSDGEAEIALDTPFIRGLREVLIAHTQPAAEAPVVVVNASDNQRISEISAVSSPLLDSWIVDFVVGNKPMSEWETFLAEMTAAGYDEILEIVERSLLQ